MIIRIEGNWNDSNDLTRALADMSGYEVEKVSEFYRNRGQTGENPEGRVYVNMKPITMDVDFLDKPTPSPSDGLIAGDPVDVCTNRGGWRGKGEFIRYDGDDNSVVKRPNGKEETYHRSRVRYTFKTNK